MDVFVLCEALKSRCTRKCDCHVRRHVIDKFRRTLWVFGAIIRVSRLGSISCCPVCYILEVQHSSRFAIEMVQLWTFDSTYWTPNVVATILVHVVINLKTYPAHSPVTRSNCFNLFRTGAYLLSSPRLAFSNLLKQKTTAFIYGQASSH